MSNTILVYFLKMYGNKKGMGVSTFANSRISNAASPRQAELYTIMAIHYNI